MKSSFLDYYKVILDKVSFDHRLFQKEYKKAYKVLTKQEAKQLDDWLQTKGLYYKLNTVQTSHTQDSNVIHNMY